MTITERRWFISPMIIINRLFIEGHAQYLLYINWIQQRNKHIIQTLRHHICIYYFFRTHKKTVFKRSLILKIGQFTTIVLTLIRRLLLWVCWGAAMVAYCEPICSYCEQI